MSVGVTPSSFVKDGKPYFLIAGEVHYFRLDPQLWDTHLRRLKESGANTVSTYIPWDWHEYAENRFDISGETDPRRNLLHYIALCQKVGLDLMVKPGPYILAEYELHGLPRWLLDRCTREARAIDENGNIIAADVMSYMSEEFLQYTFRWYDRIMPVIARHQHSRGGPITMMQVCNEVGVFQWLSGKIDYSPSVLALYTRFMRRMYGDIQSLNRRYGVKYSSFDEVLPPRGKILNRMEYAAYYDFHLFYRHYYAVYLKTLTKRIRGYGIDLQLTHNIPGWIYGNAAELPMLISTYAEVMETQRDIVFGLDHIPEFVSYRNAHSDLACNKMLEAMQPGAPVWAAEFQAGTREHHVKNDPRDMEVFYMASLAHGLKGFNYYMFSQGVNPEGKGYYGKTFYFQTPLDVTGRKSPLYRVIQRCSDFIHREERHLLSSTTRASVCVGLYKPYFFTELTTSMMLKEKRLHVDVLGLSLDPRFVREELLFHGLLRGLQTLNVPYDIRDLEAWPLERLLEYRQLWVLTTDFMDAATQQLLGTYVRKGGHLAIYPAIPTLDLYLNPCTVLKETMGLHVHPSASADKVCAFGIDDVFTVLKEKQVFEVADEQVLSTTKTGEICGIRKNVERGWVTALGFAFGYSTDDHLKVYQKILEMDRIKGVMNISDPDIQCVVRRGKRRSYVFLLNYHNQKKAFTVNGEKHSLEGCSLKIIKRPR
jgi:beta-galactosidase